ncbi:MAG TPA: DoxX family protein [Gammaproteobacteria bacterium]|jgi:putative oxidoreductase
MILQKAIGWLIELPATLLNHLQDLLSLFVRLYVGWQFFHAGWLKVNSWDSTLFLFQYEYRVPVLPPGLAAVLGTVGELLFPVLLWIGLTSRLAGVGLQFVNVMAVVSYAHVIFNPEFGTSAIVDHYLWGLMILMVIVYGPGRLSVDELLTRFKSSNAGVASSGRAAASGA